MLTPVRMMKLAFLHNTAGGFDRRPEPEQVTNESSHVDDYDRVMDTSLVLAYAVALEAIFRTGVNVQTHYDLCCGPGHFSICAAKSLDAQRLVGFDLAPNMIETAQSNAVANQIDAEFELLDVLEPIPKMEKSDLTSFTDAAHHFGETSQVATVIRNMEAATSKDGLVFIMDLVRLNSVNATEAYVEALGGDYKERGLHSFYKDFRNSMFAAWTTDELAEAVPKESERTWVQLVPRCLPTIQLIFGLPVGRSKLFTRSGVPWKENPVPSRMQRDWKLARFGVFSGKKRYLTK